MAWNQNIVGSGTSRKITRIHVAGVWPKSPIYKINNLKRSDRFSRLFFIFLFLFCKLKIWAKNERHTFRIDK